MTSRIVKSVGICVYVYVGMCVCVCVCTGHLLLQIVPVGLPPRCVLNPSFHGHTGLASGHMCILSPLKALAPQPGEQRGECVNVQCNECT